MYYHTDATGSFRSSRAAEPLIDTIYNNPEYAGYINQLREPFDYFRFEKIHRYQTALAHSFEEQWSTTRHQVDNNTRLEVEASVYLVIAQLSRITNIRILTISVTDDQSVFFQLRHEAIHGYVEIHFGNDLPVELLCIAFRDKDVVYTFEGPIRQGIASYLRALVP